MKWSERLYLGTWQFGGQFKQLSPSYIESLISLSIAVGIRRFDTASVYGNGSVETMLGSCLPSDAIVVTKIPAITKPDPKNPAPISMHYSIDYIDRCIELSLGRLKKQAVDTVLLHNWLPQWSENAIAILLHLQRLKEEGLARRVGISLPNNCSSRIGEKILPYVDVVEAPYNPEQKWILNELPDLLNKQKEILLRSLFCQGQLLPAHSTESLITDAAKLGTSMAIGMTTEYQIISNVDCLKRNSS